MTDSWESLRALESELTERMAWEMDSPASAFDLVLGALRAALAQSAPQEPTDNFSAIDVLELSPVALVEFKRLRAWEKWGREVAKPALEYTERHGGIGAEPRAIRALAAMPNDQDPQGG